MSPKAQAMPADRTDRPARNINVHKAERQLSVAVGAALMGLGLSDLGLGQASKLRGLLIAAAGGAIAYRGVTGHCHVYQALGIDTARLSRDQKRGGEREDGRVRAGTGGNEAPRSEPRAYAAKNRVDKERFDKLKATQVDRGREEEKAIEIAAEEVKELRRREGRSKENESELLDRIDETWDQK